MEENLTEINRIIVFGEEGTGKSNLLNKLSLNDNLFKINKEEEYKEINKDKDFISKKVIIEDTNFELYDTIGISPTFPISNIKEKVINFKEEIMGKGFKGIFITFSVYKVPINFDSFELIMNTFSFKNNKNLFIVFTQGDNFDSIEKKEEEYTTLKDEMKNLIRKKRYPININNILYFDNENIDSIRKKIVLMANDLNVDLSYIKFKDDGDDNYMINRLFLTFDEIDGVDNQFQNENPFLAWIKNLVNKIQFFNSPNMLM